MFLTLISFRISPLSFGKSNCRLGKSFSENCLVRQLEEVSLYIGPSIVPLTITMKTEFKVRRQYMTERTIEWMSNLISDLIVSFPTFWGRYTAKETFYLHRTESACSRLWVIGYQCLILFSMAPADRTFG